MVDFEDRRIGPEERFSGLSEGQRYALALVLNLAFVGVVIAGFAFLYTGGFGGADAPTAPAASSVVERDAADEEPTIRLAANVSPRGAGLSLPSDSLPTAEIEATELEPAADDSLELAAAAAPAASDGVGGPDVEVTEEEGIVDEQAGGESAVAALEASPPEVPEPDEAPEVVADLGPTPRLAPRVATTDITATASAVDPVGSLWSAAGSLAANLQRDFPCSQFSLQADRDGRPSLRARVGFSDDIDLVRARVDENFGDLSDVEGGLGCTTVVGGGYVALSDENGQVALFDGASLSREISAVLPGEGTCAVIGQVVATQPNLVQRLASAGQEAAWVRSGGEPALCEVTDTGTWQVVSARNASGRRAAALVLGDDVVATDARRAANLNVPAASVPPAVESEPEEAQDYELDLASASDERLTRVSSTSDAGGLREVAPVEGPTPLLPAGVAPSADGYAVSVAFTVDEDGKAQDLTVTGAGMAGVSVVAAALDVINASRFPATGETYRGSYTVRFASAEFQDLLTRLSLATAAGREAEPIWDRAPTQADYDRHYPDRALRRGISGEVQANCSIAYDGRLTCSVARETPRGWGFGGAALSLAEIMRAGPRMSDGGPSANETVQIEFVFSSNGTQ